MSLDIIAQLWAAGASFAGMGRKLGVSRPWSLAESTGPRSVFLPLPVARGVSACGVCLPDLEQPRPPDLAPGLVKLPKAERNRMEDHGATATQASRNWISASAASSANS